MIIRHLIVALCLSVSLYSTAQTPKQYFSIESPNSSALRGMLESPVTLNTGKTGVTIPIYTLKQKDIQVPIVLAYNSGGVKLDVHPGWVGSNWTLHTGGGSITRNVKGIPDELYWRNDFVLTDSKNTSGSQQMPFGYAWNNSNAGGSWNTTQTITDLAKAGIDPNTFWVESEPDEFFFECGEYSGKFYMDHLGGLRVQGHADIKVEGTVITGVPLFDETKPLNANDPNTFTSVAQKVIGTDQGGNPIWLYTYNRISKAYLMGFKITTPDGLQYEYGMYGKPYIKGSTFNDVEFTSAMFDQFYFDEIFTTWHLTKITSPSNEFVEFVYKKGDPIIQLGTSFSFYKAGGTGDAKGFLGFLFGGPSAFTQDAKLETNGRFIRPVYLSQIKSNTTIIDFSLSTSHELAYNYLPIITQIIDRSRFYDRNYFCPLYSRLMLGTVRQNTAGSSPGYIDYGNNDYSVIRYDGLIEDLDFDLLSWAKLDKITITSKSSGIKINEWNFMYNEVPNERLQLFSLQERSLNPYVFEYDRSKTLPGYNSLQIDHWGYYNGRVAPIDIANPASLGDPYKNLREPVEACLYAGSLIQVTTPTKGIKQFVYEPNKYSSIVKRNSQTGAFSVESVGTEKTGAGLRIRQIIEKFGEGSPDVTTTYTYGSGTLLGDVQYYWPSYSGKLLNGNAYSSTRFVTESLLPVSDNPGGGVISYELVNEEKTGNGKKTYQYTSFATNADETGVSIDLEKSPYSPFTSREFERGLLKSVSTYEISNPTLEVSSEVYEYTVNPGFNTDFIRAVEARGTTMFGSDQVNVIDGTAYKHYLHPYQKTKKTTQIRDKNVITFFTTIEDYSYNVNLVPNNDNQMKEVKITNSSNEITSTKYKHPSDFQVNDGVEELTGLNSLKEKHILNALVSEERSIKPVDQPSYSITSYTLNTFLKGAQGFPVLSAIYDLKLPSKSSSNATIIGPSVFTPDPRLNIEVTFNKYDEFGNLRQYTSSDGIPITILYGYSHTYPVAMIKNTTYDNVLAVLGQGVVDQLNTSPGTDAELRLKLQPLRTAPSLVNALITTYTYTPLVGMTSRTDPNNLSTYYEYDSLNRLKLIKDSNQNIVKTFSYQYQFK